MAKGAVYVATESGQVEVDGVSLPIYAGVTRVREGHKLLKVAPLFFKPADESVHYEVEQATKAPGEQRKTTSKAKRAK